MSILDSHAQSTQPSPQHSPLLDKFEKEFRLTSDSQVLDLACGSGRNGAWFVKRGCQVSFVDINLEGLLPELKRHSLAFKVERDLESGPKAHLGSFDLVLVFNYLHRPLMPFIMDTVKPGGILIYETFTQQQASIGRPRNPDFLLETTELKSLFAPWQQLYYGEEAPDPISGAGAYKAAIICRKPME